MCFIDSWLLKLYQNESFSTVYSYLYYIYILRDRIFFKKNSLTICPYYGIETRRFMRAHPGLFHLCFTTQSGHDKDTTKYECINALLKSPSNKEHPIMCSWAITRRKRKNSDSRKLCLWRFKGLLRTSVRRKTHSRWKDLYR